MRSLLLLGLLAAGPAMADVTFTGPSTQPTLTLTSRTETLTGEIASPRGKRERLLIGITTVTRETIGEKGIEGDVEITARPVEAGAAPLYTLKQMGRAAALDDGGLIVIDQDDCCALYRAYVNPANAAKLFESTVATAPLTLEGLYWKRRTAAFVSALDDRPDHKAWGDKAIGLITYAAADRVVGAVLVEAADAETARRLKSIDDERMSLAWVDAKTGAPIVTVPEGDAVQPVLRLHFVTSNLAVLLPLRKDALVTDIPPTGITLKARAALPLAGGWRVKDAYSAPWAQGTPVNALKDRHILFGPDAVRSAGSVLDCGKATYDEALVPPEGLFMGAGLNATQAASLGLTEALSPSVTLTCDSGVFTFHRASDGRQLFALDNVIYALERVVD